MQKKWLIVGIIVLIVGIFLVWLFIASSKPLPGQKITDLGREHVPVGTQVEYNSNPPTSGKHYADWVRKGVYETPLDDGNLIHSLEHGYIILSYNCDKKVTLKRHPDENQDLYGFRSVGRSIKFGMTFVSDVYAHGIEEASPSAQESSPSAILSDVFRSDDCHKLVDQMISVYEKKGKKKLIVIPRPNLDARIALTAWTYIDKFDDFDASRIEKFIDAYRDQGPEKTVE